MADWFGRKSNVAFGVCLALLAAIKLLFDNYPGSYPVEEQAAAFTWPIVIFIMLFGGSGLMAERSLRLPDPFADWNLEKRGLAWATLAGICYGLLTVGLDIFEGRGAPLSLNNWEHVPWPWSVPFYSFGAIFLEFLLRLGALCGFVWFIHVVLLRGRGFAPIFWAVNAIVSLYEVLPSTIEAWSQGNWLGVAATPLQPLYWTNLFEGLLLLRFGWFSPIVFRLAFYLIWHILYGGMGPFF